MLTRRSWRLLIVSTAMLLLNTNASADPQPDPCAVSILPGGTIVALTGVARAIDECDAARHVECEHTLFAGETLSTGPDSAAGVMVGDVLVVLAPNSSARIGVGDEGVADVLLRSGGVRLIDPREQGPPAQLSVANASARFVGNDAEAHLFEQVPTLCGWKEPLLVARNGDRSLERCDHARPGTSAIALVSGDGTAGAEMCEPRPAISTIAYLAPLPPVGAAAPGTGPPLPTEQDGPPRSPCDVPGSGCAFSSDFNFSLTEQPPGDLSFPGAGGTFPGGGGQP